MYNPTRTGKGDAIENGMGTSHASVQVGHMAEEVLVNVRRDVSSQLSLQWGRAEELDNDLVCYVYPRLARWAPNQEGLLACYCGL